MINDLRKLFVLTLGLTCLVPQVLGVTTSCFVDGDRDKCKVQQTSDSFSDHRTGIHHKVGDTVKEKELCLPQGKDDYTFAVFSAGRKNIAPEDYIEKILVMDNSCKLLGLYDYPYDCPAYSGCPRLRESYLPFTMVLEPDNFAFGSDDGASADTFGFFYANGYYSANVNHCGCEEFSGWPSVVGCKCAFPLHGQKDKRAIEFKG